MCSCRTAEPNQTEGLPPASLVDQSNIPDWDGAWTNLQPANRATQTFTPEVSLLRAVDIDIATGNPGHGGDTITLEILRGDTLLGSASQDVPEGHDGLLSFILAEAIPVTPGELLAIRVCDTGKGVFGWKHSVDTYPGGQRIFFGTPRPQLDYFFQTR